MSYFNPFRFFIKWQYCICSKWIDQSHIKRSPRETRDCLAKIFDLWSNHNERLFTEGSEIYTRERESLIVIHFRAKQMNII